MSKRVHPIRKMRRSLEKKHYLRRVIWPPTNQKIEADIARHVKPLLDALDTFGHSSFHHDDPDPICEVCRLLAAWKEPLR